MIFWLKNNYRDKYSDSLHTPLEEELTKQQIKRAKAEAEMAQAKADLLTGNGDTTDGTVIIDDIGGRLDGSGNAKEKSD